jgi:hypothetical protein
MAAVLADVHEEVMKTEQRVGSTLAGPRKADSQWQCTPIPPPA